MNYTIKYARKGTRTIFLEKNGNKYVVSDWDTVTHKTTFREELDRFEYADAYFLGLCEGANMEPVEVEHDPFELMANVD